MEVDTDIQKAKGQLISRAKRNGLWENFGQKEVRTIQDKYGEHQYAHDGVWDKILAFSHWCETYTT